MKKLALIILLFISATVAVKAQKTDTTTLTKVGDMAPSFTFSLSKENMASIEAYHGKIVLINLFATWCPPCQAEMPRVQKEIWEKYKDNPKFALFAFGREEGWNVVLPFKEKNNYTFNILPDLGRKVFKLYATQYIPRNILLDESGKIIYQSIGYSEKEFDQLLLLLAKRLDTKL